MLRWIAAATPEDAARAAADIVAEAAARAVAGRGTFTLALSGGSSPLLMLAELAAMDLPWSAFRVFQVDERVAPDGDPARNLTALAERLPSAARLHPMPVIDADLSAAAARHATELPERFDLIHLGVGDDGHTASLVPGDPVLDVTDLDVTLTETYRGHRRMTLTYPVLDRARQILWLATGPDKRGPLGQLLRADAGIPAGRVRAADQIVVCDHAADPR